MEPSDDSAEDNSEFRRNLTKIPLFQTALDWLGVNPSEQKWLKFLHLCICPVRGVQAARTPSSPNFDQKEVGEVILPSCVWLMPPFLVEK